MQKDRKDDDTLAGAKRRQAEDAEADREYTTPERAAVADAPPGGEKGVPIDRRDEDPDWRSKAAGTSRPESPGPARGDRGRDAREEAELRRQAEAGLAPRDEGGQ